MHHDIIATLAQIHEARLARTIGASVSRDVVTSFTYSLSEYCARERAKALGELYVSLQAGREANTAAAIESANEMAKKSTL